jgi:hypothetical protein
VTRSAVVIVVLSVALAATNLWWFYHAIDSASAAADRDSQYRLEHEALAQTLSVLPVAARADSTSADIIAAASKAASHKDSFQKDGFIWVGQLGLKFGDAGRLNAVKPAWQPF